MNAAPESLQSVFDRTFAGMSQTRESFTPQLTPHEVGTITSVSTGIARVSGLPSVGFEELVKFPGGAFGIAFNLDEDEIGVVLLGEYSHLHAGDEVERTGRVMDVAVGDGLLGRVIDPLGRPLDGKGTVAANRRLPIERPAAHIMVFPGSLMYITLQHKHSTVTTRLFHSRSLTYTICESMSTACYCIFSLLYYTSRESSWVAMR